MEFFEFDNSFISDRGSQQTALSKDDYIWLNGKNDDGNWVGFTCREVKTFKDNNATVPSQASGGGNLGCINDMPYRKQTVDKAPNVRTDRINSGAAKKF